MRQVGRVKKVPAKALGYLQEGESAAARVRRFITEAVLQEGLETGGM